MSVDPSAWREEEERLARVLAEIEAQRAEAGRREQVFQGRVLAARRGMWQDAPRMVDSFDDVIELSQASRLLQEDERSHAASRAQLLKLEQMAESPYFGRIDFQVKGQAAPEAVYIGRRGLTARDGGQRLIYDWRTPIAGMFYDYSTGPAAYVAEAGRVEGEIRLKRQYEISGGRLEYMFDSELAIGDEILREQLGRRGGGRMRDIVESIQREQNLAIRDEEHDVLLVQGAAGSGKTSVALHRVAYLLYRRRRELAAHQVTVFSPNELLARHIAGVLPDLGEEGVAQTTIHAYARRLLGGGWRVERPYEQVERLLTRPPGAAAHAAAAFKGGKEFVEVLDRLVHELERGPAFRDVVYDGEVVAKADDLRRLFQEAYGYLPYAKRLEKLTRRIQFLLDRAYGAKRAKIRKEASAAGLNPADMPKPPPTRPALEAARVWRHPDPVQLYRELFENPDKIAALMAPKPLPQGFSKIRRLTLESLDRRRILFEDLAPILLLKLGLQGGDGLPAARHVVADEVQDLSYAQFVLLRRLFPHARFTLLGDPRQTLQPSHTPPGEGEIAEALGGGRLRSIHLSRSYRSTYEITLFAQGLLAGDVQSEPFDRRGPKPLVAGARDSGELALRIEEGVAALTSRWKSVAIVCKTAAEAAAAAERLRGRLPVHLLTGEDDEPPEDGVWALPVYLAKGIEFEAVAVYNASAESYSRPSDRRLLYTACTRALHELQVYYAGQVSPFIAEADPALYERA